MLQHFVLFIFQLEFKSKWLVCLEINDNKITVLNGRFPKGMVEHLCMHKQWIPGSLWLSLHNYYRIACV